MAKRGVRTYPPHIVPDFTGSAIDDASGFLVKASDRVDDTRQGFASIDKADLTPGFGTHHPQDVKRLGHLDDPSPIENARTDTVDQAGYPTKEDVANDLGWTLYEVDAYIARTGRMPHEGATK